MRTLAMMPGPQVPLRPVSKSGRAAGVKQFQIGCITWIRLRLIAWPLIPTSSWLSAQRVQFALLLVTVQTIPYLHHPWNWQLPSLVHLALLALQLLPGAIAWGWMIYEMVDVTPRFAITGAVINLIGNLVVGAVVMVLVPAMAAMLALHALHP